MDTNPPPGSDLNTPPPSAYQKPADYYAAPAAPPGRSGCPRWVPITCGVVALFALIVIFAGGAYLARGGASKLVDYAFSQVQDQISAMYSADVPTEDRDRLDQDLTALRRRAREGKVPLTSVQPLLRKMQDAISDRRLSRGEVTDLVDSIERTTGERGAGR
jgi:hypothetical protein